MTFWRKGVVSASTTSFLPSTSAWRKRVLGVGRHNAAFDPIVNHVWPPHLYVLVPREALFHGVQALRLSPIGEGNMFGRTRLLAHPWA
jgi:hypothetical protein